MNKQKVRLISVNQDYLQGLEEVARGVVQMMESRVDDAPCPFCGAKPIRTASDETMTRHSNCLGMRAQRLVGSDDASRQPG